MRLFSVCATQHMGMWVTSTGLWGGKASAFQRKSVHRNSDCCRMRSTSLGWPDTRNPPPLLGLHLVSGLSAGTWQSWSTGRMGRHPDHSSPNLWMGGPLAPTSSHEKQVGFSARTTGRSACHHSEGGRTGGSARGNPRVDPQHSPHFPSASRLFPVPADLPSLLTQLPAVIIPHRWPGPPRINPRDSQHSPSPGPGVSEAAQNWAFLGASRDTSPV